MAFSFLTVMAVYLFLITFSICFRFAYRMVLRSKIGISYGKMSPAFLLRIFYKQFEGNIQIMLNLQNELGYLSFHTSTSSNSKVYLQIQMALLFKVFSNVFCKLSIYSHVYCTFYLLPIILVPFLYLSIDIDLFYHIKKYLRL